MSKRKLHKDRNLVLSKRAKASLILIFSVNTNRESVAYRSFNLLLFKFQVRGVRKVTTGITGMLAIIIIFQKKQKKFFFTKKTINNTTILI